MDEQNVTKEDEAPVLDDGSHWHFPDDCGKASVHPDLSHEEEA